MNRRYDAVLFDLLTALLDSWSLWNTVAGDADSGHRWRMAYLRITYAAGHYRPYEQLVGDAAQAVGLPAPPRRRTGSALRRDRALAGGRHRAGRIARGRRCARRGDELLRDTGAPRGRAAFRCRSGWWSPPSAPAATNPILCRIDLPSMNSASPRSAACSWRGPPMICSAPNVSGCPHGGTTGSACPRLPAHRSRWHATAH